MIRESVELESKIVDALYRGACDAAELTRAIEMIAKYFGSPGITLALLEMDRAKADRQLMLTCGVLGPSELRRYHEYAHVDPIPRAFAGIAPGTMATSNQLLPDDGSDIVFRNEYLLPMGVDENLGGPLSRSNARLAAISILKGVNQENFGDGDIARLSRLTPHLTRALQIRQLFLQGESRGAVLESIVDLNETGMIGLSSDGATLFVNAAIRAMAAARDGIGLDRSGQLVVDRNAARRINALAAEVVGGGAGGVVAVPRPSGRPPYVVLIAPLPVREDLFAAGILFAIHDPLRSTATTAQRIAEVLRLPPGAAKLVQALLEGLDLREYADHSGISINTVRSHLKMAFARTETHSQSDLMRVALRALNDLGPYFPKPDRQ